MNDTRIERYTITGARVMQGSYQVGSRSGKTAWRVVENGVVIAEDIPTKAEAEDIAWG